jgi:hypothetical protein
MKLDQLIDWYFERRIIIYTFIFPTFYDLFDIIISQYIVNSFTPSVISLANEL